VTERGGEDAKPGLLIPKIRRPKDHQKGGEKRRVGPGAKRRQQEYLCGGEGGGRGPDFLRKPDNNLPTIGLVGKTLIWGDEGRTAEVRLAGGSGSSSKSRKGM